MTELSLHVQNVGGIENQEATFEEGVTIVSGPNASNKTSLLNALAFAVGADDVPIRSGKSTAEVELSIGDRSITQVAERVGNGVSTSGETWIENTPDALATFAVLLEFNSLRAAVHNDQSFKETLTAPLDIDALEEERSTKLMEKRSVQQNLDELQGVTGDLEAVVNDLETKRDRIEELEDKLESLRNEQAEQKGTDDELETLREDRANFVSERDDQRRQVENTEETIDRLEDRLTNVESQLKEATERADEYNIEEIRAEMERHERQISEREERVEILQSVLTTNREMLASQVTGVLGQERSLTGDTYTCWACGQQADTDAFESTTDELVELIEQDQAYIRKRQPRIEEIQSKLETAEDAKATVRDLRAERSNVKETLSMRRDSLETQRERLQEIESRLEDISNKIDARRDAAQDSDADHSDEIEETRVAIRTVRSEIDRLEDQRRELRSQRQKRDELEERLAEVKTEIKALTDEIENAERQLRESFNETMDDLVEVLGFDRIQRVWLDGEFELVIAREVDGGVERESVSHLSESERELIGLVLAVAGYLAYDVAEHTPVLAIDSLGAFDIARAQRLIEYLSGVATYVVVAEFPERAVDLDFSVTELRSPSSSGA